MIKVLRQNIEIIVNISKDIEYPKLNGNCNESFLSINEYFLSPIYLCILFFLFILFQRSGELYFQRIISRFVSKANTSFGKEMKEEYESFPLLEEAQRFVYHWYRADRIKKINFSLIKKESAISSGSFTVYICYYRK